MLYLKQPKRVYLYILPLDFRKQINGLCYLVEAEFKGELFRGSWFVFVSKDARKVKILYWRNTGFALFLFRLEKERFKLGFPRDSSKGLISWENLKKFLNGYHIFQGRPHEEIFLERYS